MPKIKVLSDEQARKIAAGEVVERPANIVKELIENSIDAQADSISIYIEEGGKKLIKVIDNGCGMSSEDAKLCFLHHATSKLSNIEDLNTLITFGFRGEALSSISSVSKVKLITKDQNSLQGTSLTLVDGKIKNSELIACAQGTQIIIEDIFYNVPARQKFLKKHETELRQIILLFQAFCLSYKNIHFKLFHDSNLLYNCPAVDNLTSRVTQLWDYNLAQNILELQLYNEQIKIEVLGGITNYQVAKFNRSQIFLFVNGRWVKNQSIIRALLKGYLNVLPHGKFPAAFIFLKIPTNLVDVNIHPRKEEVLFFNAKKIESLLTECVKKNLEESLNRNIQSKNIDFKNDNPYFKAATTTTFDFESLNTFEPIDNHPNELAMSQVENTIEKNIHFDANLDIHLQKQNSVLQNDSIKDIEQEYQIIGQYKLCYILLEKEDGLFLIDQHAAHERILYELFISRFNDIAKVKLIFPVIISLKESNLDLISNYLHLLDKYGIEVQCFSKDQVVIHSIPVHLKDVALDSLINQFVSWIEEYQFLEEQEFFKLINDKLCAQMACKAAVKAGYKLTQEQMVQLLNDLQKTENRFACPHGRPTGWLLNHNDIEKKFKRKL